MFRSHFQHFEFSHGVTMILKANCEKEVSYIALMAAMIPDLRRELTFLVKSSTFLQATLQSSIKASYPTWQSRPAAADNEGDRR
jgi:hypothetical protein